MNRKSTVLFLMIILFFEPIILGGTIQPSSVLPDARPQDSINRSQTPPSSPSVSAVRSGAHKNVVYLVCAARYSIRADAERHMQTLRLFGYSSKLDVNSQNTFRVVLGKSNKRSKAEDVKSDFVKRGLACFIDEE